MKIKFLSILSTILLIFQLTSKNILAVSNQESERLSKSIARIEQYESNFPDNYELINWTEKALGFDELVFNYDAEGDFLPLIWEDTTHSSFGIPAYVGDGRMHQDGNQEAVTNIAAVLSASLNGIDKSEYVSQLTAFYSEEEQIILNNPTGSSESTSMWYLLYPTILYAHVSDLYPENTEIRDTLLNTIDSWYKAYEIMYNNGDPSFDYTGFNFNSMEPYKNDVWTEPDSAVGIGLIMYYGYQLTNDEKYIEAAINCMDFIESYFGSSLYEALMYFGPYLASQLNIYHGTDYDLLELFNDNFNASSIPRGGWGSVVGKWGDYPVNGLFGSDTDGGGYVFAMNTFAASGAILPTAQYDARYARSLGIWALNLISNSRFYFSENVTEENQSLSMISDKFEIKDEIKQFVPYEGIRKNGQGKTPWVGGDPLVYDWAQTDFSLYSGAHIGILSSMINETNVEGVLSLELTKTQFYKEKIFKSFLLYNPYDENVTVVYEKVSNEQVDLFDSVTNEIVAENINDTVELVIPKDSALVITEIPTQSEIIEREGHLYIDDIYLSSKLISLNDINYSNNEKVEGSISIVPEIATNYDYEIEAIDITIDDVTNSFINVDDIVIDTNDFEPGTKRVQIEVKTTDGRIDIITRRLRFN
ncbi:hypothetical protein ACTQ54_01140 [Fundicoccus sp. Sow4_H7]|uniref:hypothetical protein n=1 Tax=Fundicoccus sp. Sow4_H7 TaxID=3438784 RepID=UPI003F8E545E